MDDISYDVNERDEARGGAWLEVATCKGTWEKTQMCSGAWKARGARDQWNRTFERRVGACVVSNGVEGSTSV